MMAISLVLALTLTIVGNAYSEKVDAESCTFAQNKLRSLHINTPDLKWDNTLAVKAQQYADELVRRNRGLKNVYLAHSKSSVGLGENIFWAAGNRRANCARASLDWYMEINNYDFKTAKSTNGGAIGHFTQLVWRGSTRFGVGIATTPYRNNSTLIETFVVAKYAPQGNMYYKGKRLEAYTENVQPRKNPKGKIPSISELNM